jgi:predicted Zn-dependent peptidase
MNRRESFKLLMAGAAAASILPGRAAQARSADDASLVLDNGFRTHVLPNDSQYVSATLILRSKDIVHANGLAHLLEHTSFAGAAGSFSAEAIEAWHQDSIQKSNASTEPGALRWDLSFLPQYLPDVINLLALTSLDQQFDVPTVAQEARVVLEELYLEKYDAKSLAQHKFDVALYGASHPHARETTDAEIAKAKTPPERLAAELRQYASTIKLPANMDLFLAGAVEPKAVQELVDEHFGRYAFAQGPLLAMPNVDVTRAHHALVARSQELKQPLSQLKIGWNTGVRITDPEARVLLALCEYLNTMLFKELREAHGDTYNPEAVYEPDTCSGIFRIMIPSSKDPLDVEKRALQAIQTLKVTIDARELSRFKDRIELRRRTKARSNEDLVDSLVQRAVDGVAIDDLRPETVTRDELLAAAHRYLPVHKGGYVRLALRGQ